MRSVSIMRAGLKLRGVACQLASTPKLSLVVLRNKLGRWDVVFFCTGFFCGDLVSRGNGSLVFAYRCSRYFYQY